MRDPRDYQAIKVCPYCGDEYGGRLMCCGEHHGHATWVTDCPGLEENQYASEEACWLAIEEACRDSNIALAESLGERNA